MAQETIEGGKDGQSNRLSAFLLLVHRTVRREQGPRETQRLNQIDNCWNACLAAFIISLTVATDWDQGQSQWAFVRTVTIEFCPFLIKRLSRLLD